MMLRRKIILISFILLFTILIFYRPYSTFNDIKKDDETYILWQFGDIKPFSRGIENFAEAIGDMNHLPYDDAIVVGDIVESSSLEEYDTYLQILAKSYHGFQDFHHLAGNHEYQCEGGEKEGCLDNYKEKIDQRLFYALDEGNIHFIIISTDKNYSHIKDSTFDWLKKEVTNNQDKILIIATHQAPHLFRFGVDRSIDTLLKDNGVDLWIFGHMHCKHGDAGCSRHGARGDFYTEDEIVFVDTGFIENSESRYFIFEENSDKVIIKSRNHHTSSFQDEFEHIVDLRYPFLR